MGGEAWPVHRAMPARRAALILPEAPQSAPLLALRRSNRHAHFAENGSWRRESKTGSMDGALESLEPRTRPTRSWPIHIATHVDAWVSERSSAASRKSRLAVAVSGVRCCAQHELAASALQKPAAISKSAPRFQETCLQTFGAAPADGATSCHRPIAAPAAGAPEPLRLGPTAQARSQRN